MHATLYAPARNQLTDEDVQKRPFGALSLCMQETTYCPGASSKKPSSEEVCLLHDPKELFLVDLAVAVTVCLVNHLLELLICNPFTKLLRKALQVLEGDLSCLVVIEKTECLQDFVLWVPVQNLVRHHLQELLVLDRPAAIVIDVRDHPLDLLFLRFESQGAHRDLQLFGVDGATAVGIKEVERLLDLLLLLLGEFLLLLPALVEAAERPH